MENGRKNRKCGIRMKKPAYLFGDIVVVDYDKIGVIVKTWKALGAGNDNKISYDVYVREYNGIREYLEKHVARYRVRHKYVDSKEIELQEGEQIK